MMRRGLLTALLLPIVALGLAPVAEQQRVLRRRAIFAGAASAVLAPAAALALPGVFECFEEVDGYVVNVCKKDRLERERSAPPRPRPEEREVDMALVNGALERARMKKANIHLRETPEWLGGGSAAAPSAPEVAAAAPPGVVVDVVPAADPAVAL